VERLDGGDVDGGVGGRVMVTVRRGVKPIGVSPFR
jgi:hypothetical protein